MNYQKIVRFFRRSAQHWVDSATCNNDEVYYIMQNINYADAVTTHLGHSFTMRNVTETNCNGKLVFVQLKNFREIDVTRNFWLNSVYNNWLCYGFQTVAVQVVWHRKWVLHFIFACIRDQKTASKCTQNYFGDIKMIFFLGSGHSRLPRTSPSWRLAPFLKS